MTAETPSVGAAGEHPGWELPATGQAGRLYLTAKRALDVSVAAIGLVVGLPGLVLIALAVRRTPGPVLFRQTRVGRGGRTFRMLKFRTMHAGTDDRVHRDYVTRLLREESPPAGRVRGLYKLEDDRRVTRVGAWLRRTSLDELPQLWNVLRGEMSLVGPRPALPYEVELYEPPHRERLTVRPGITGLWQVSGRSQLSMRQALDLDVEYVRRRGLGLDLWILARTVPVVLSMRGVR